MEDSEQPCFEELGPLRIAGLGESYTGESSAGIPALWQRFVPHLGKIAGQIGGVAYGVLIPGVLAGHFDYVCAVQVTDFSNIPNDFVRMGIAKQKYAVFSHPGYITSIRDTWDQVWNKWIPELNLRVAPSPRLERYRETFRPADAGGVEICIPILK